MNYKQIKIQLNLNKNIEKAVLLSRYFKTDKGEYGYGDKFLGITVPILRNLAKECKDSSFNTVTKLVNSVFHEERLLGFLILTYKYSKTDESINRKIFNYYLKHLSKVNNWDIVDLTAPNIIGKYLLSKPKNILKKFAKSNNLWIRRISIISTYEFIKNREYSITFEIADILLRDKHDLIHKAVGWMLREIGKRDLILEEEYLKSNYKVMPRTMLRYSIEKFPEQKRIKYLKGLI